VKQMPLSKITVDEDIQPRAAIDTSVIAEYKECIEAGDKFPPVIVFDDGTTNRLSDGFHTFEATRQAGKDKILADVRQGTKRDAILFACSANAVHGLRRTPADKRHVVLRLLNDSQWSKRSDRWIAKMAAVSNTFVSRLREEQSAHLSTLTDSQPQTREVSRGGTTYQQKVRIPHRIPHSGDVIIQARETGHGTGPIREDPNVDDRKPVPLRSGSHDAGPRIAVQGEVVKPRAGWISQSSLNEVKHLVETRFSAEEEHELHAWLGQRIAKRMEDDE
jgi:hypothetical protein